MMRLVLIVLAALMLTGCESACRSLTETDDVRLRRRGSVAAAERNVELDMVLDKIIFHRDRRGYCWAMLSSVTTHGWTVWDVEPMDTLACSGAERSNEP